MAEENKTMNFGVDLLPTEDNSFSLGNNAKQWKINGVIPILTDRSVTEAQYHYSPTTASEQDKTATASGGTALWGVDVVKGITINTDGKGHITGLSVDSGKTASNIATYNAQGLVKPWFTYTKASTGPTSGSSSSSITVNALETTSGRYYAIEGDKDGRLFVNVPWTDTNTLVTQNNTTTTSWRKIILGYGTYETSNYSVSNTTSTTCINANISAQPSTGTIRANIYRVQDNVELQWNDTDKSLDFVFI